MYAKHYTSTVNQDRRVNNKTKGYSRLFKQALLKSYDRLVDLFLSKIVCNNTRTLFNV
jgi:hypothetical protein